MRLDLPEDDEVEGIYRDMIEKSEVSNDDWIKLRKLLKGAEPITFTARLHLTEDGELFFGVSRNLFEAFVSSLNGE